METRSFLVGMQNRTATLEDSPATEPFGAYLPKGVENSHKTYTKMSIVVLLIASQSCINQYVL